MPHRHSHLGRLQDSSGPTYAAKAPEIFYGSESGLTRTSQRHRARSWARDGKLGLGRQQARRICATERAVTLRSGPYTASAPVIVIVSEYDPETTQRGSIAVQRIMTRVH